MNQSLSTNVLAEVFSAYNGVSDKTVLTFIGSEVVQLSYYELYQHIESRAYALLTQVKGSIGERVLFCIEDELEFCLSFLACLRVGYVPVLASPSGLLESRYLEKILRISCSRTILTDKLLGDCCVNVIDIKYLNDCFQQSIQLPDIMNIKPSECFIQFSSGSTGNPKGIVISHSNLHANLRLAQELYGIEALRVGCGWTPLYHDMGLVGSFLLPLFQGGHAIRVKTQLFTADPLVWLKAISKYKATFVFAPDSAYRYCISAASSVGKSGTGLDLTSLMIAVIAGEAVQKSTMKLFYECFMPMGLGTNVLSASYGLTETTMVISGQKHGAPAIWRNHLGRDVVSSGHTGCGHSIEIVDPVNGHVLDCNQEGEVLVAGVSVFDQYLVKSQMGPLRYKIGPLDYFRTGDLGILDQYGNLFITGRLSNQIIINGKNYSSEDVEENLLAVYEEYTTQNVMVFQNAQGINLVVEWVDAKRLEHKLIQKTITNAEKILKVGINRVVFVKNGKLARTGIGKIARKKAIEQLDEECFVKNVLYDYVSNLRKQASFKLQIKYALNRYYYCFHASSEPQISALRYIDELVECSTSLACAFIINFVYGESFLNPHDKYPISDKLASFALSEDGSGSDLSSIETVYSYHEKSIRIRGKKSWGGNQWSDQVILIAQSSNQRGCLASFLVPAGHPGVEFGRPNQTIGLEGLQGGSVTVDFSAPDECMLSQVSYQQLQQVLLLARVYVSYLSACCVALAASESVKYHSEYNSIRNIKVSEAWKAVSIIKDLCVVGVKKWDAKCTSMVAAINALKVISTRYAKDVVDEICDTHGYHAYLRYNRLSMIYNDLRAFTIIEGNNLSLMRISNGMIQWEHLLPMLDGYSLSEQEEARSLLMGQHLQYMPFLGEINKASSETLPEKSKQDDSLNVMGWLRAWVCRHMDIEGSALSLDESLFSYGLTSLNSLLLVDAIASELSVNIDVEDIWDGPTINDIVKLIEDKIASKERGVE